MCAHLVCIDIKISDLTYLCNPRLFDREFYNYGIMVLITYNCWTLKLIRLALLKLVC